MQRQIGKVLGAGAGIMMLARPAGTAIPPASGLALTRLVTPATNSYLREFGIYIISPASDAGGVTTKARMEDARGAILSGFTPVFSYAPPAGTLIIGNGPAGGGDGVGVPFRDWLETFVRFENAGPGPIIGSTLFTSYIIWAL